MTRAYQRHSKRTKTLKSKTKFAKADTNDFLIPPLNYFFSEKETTESVAITMHPSGLSNNLLQTMENSFPGKFFLRFAVIFL